MEPLTIYSKNCRQELVVSSLNEHRITLRLHTKGEAQQIQFNLSPLEVATLRDRLSLWLQERPASTPVTLCYNSQVGWSWYRPGGWVSGYFHTKEQARADIIAADHYVKGEEPTDGDQ